MTSIDRLRTLIPVPAKPVAAQGDWAQVQQRLGLRLPADYHALITSYGLGGFDDIYLQTPFAPESHANMVTGNLAQTEIRRDARAYFPEAFPHPVYPEPGGLLHWASTGNGDELSWLTSPAEDPDSWPIVISYRHRDGTDQHNFSCTQLLHAYFSGQLDIPEFGPAPAQPWFEPAIDRTHVYITLSDGIYPYKQRLQNLRNVLAPTADRGSWDSGDDSRQDHFKATARDWLLTYETAYGHTIRIAFPRGQDQEARTALRAATTAMGVSILRTTPPGWMDHKPTA